MLISTAFSEHRRHMAKKHANRAPIPPRKCIFCGASASSKGEHFWPVWSHRYLPRGKRKLEISYFQGADPSDQLQQTKAYDRQGAVYTKTVRCVCMRCNNEWMSALEEQVKCLLLALIEDRPVTILAPGIKTLTEWITLKILIAENDSREGGVTCISDVQDFAVSRKIPPQFRIWITRLHGQSGWQTQLESIRAGISPDENGPLNFNAVTFGIGKLVVHVRNSTVHNFDVHQIFERIEPLELLFPRLAILNPRLIWPPEWSMEKSSVDSLTKNVIRFLELVRKNRRLPSRPKRK